MIQKVRVLVSDGGVPAQTDVVLVTVNVNRNLEKPKFSEREINVNLLETTHLGEPFTVVEATDEDNHVCPLYKRSYTMLHYLTYILTKHLCFSGTLQ